MQSTANKMVSAVCLCLAIILLTAMPVSAQAPTIESASEISSASNSPFADVLLDTVEPEQYGKLEITFNLDAVYDNTFDPDALSKFADAASIAGYAKSAAAYGVKQGLITGVTETRFEPSSHTTRAQAAVLLLRMLRALDFSN